MNNSTSSTISGSVSFTERIIAWVVKRRVPITTMVFVALIAEDVINGFKPHNLANIQDEVTIVGLGLVLFGLVLRSWAAGMLHKNETLSVAGPYGLVRNPLYVGSFLMMVGFAVLIDDPENIWIVLGPFLLLFFYQVRQEERVLAETFGQAWDDYVKATPRFIPRRLMPMLAGEWSLQQWRRNREYQALGASAIGLVALQIWHTA